VKLPNCNITFLSTARRVLLPFQESRVVNRKNTHSLVTSPLTQIDFKSFPGIVGKYLLVFADVYLIVFKVKNSKDIKLN
jgi:hypothetical protein